ncbi:Rhs family protein [Yersinia similis]|nr:Rhs family protein [Yersinia similis]
MTTRHAGGRVQHFAYDDDNRLLRAWGTGPLGEHDSHYRYDALGRRIHKSVTIKRGAEKTTRQTDFIWQGLRLLQEQHADGNATYIYDPNESYTPLARVDQRHGETESQVYYFHTDINGTPLDVTDGEGKHRWSGKYHAWGKVTRQNVSDSRQSTVSRFAQPLRYPGQYSDDETGLHYNTFRYYDPEIGRFSTQDPIGLAGGINLYQYGPNPLGWVDPLGLANLFDLGTYGGLNGGIHVGDGLQAHELIRHEFLKQLGLANDTRLSSNPSIALDLDHHTRGPLKDSRGIGGVHYHEAQVRAERGLGINQFASKIADELDITSEAMKRAGVPETQISKLRGNAEKFYGNLSGC